MVASERRLRGGRLLAKNRGLVVDPLLLGDDRQERVALVGCQLFLVGVFLN